MENKTKLVTGTVHYSGPKHTYIIGSDGEIYVIDYELKHLTRFKTNTYEPGQLITVVVKNKGMGNDVVDIHQPQQESQIAI